MPRHVMDDGYDVKNPVRTSPYSCKENDPLTSNLDGIVNLRDRQAQQCRQQQRGGVTQPRGQNGHLQPAEVTISQGIDRCDAHCDPTQVISSYCCSSWNPWLARHVLHPQAPCLPGVLWTSLALCWTAQAQLSQQTMSCSNERSEPMH